jgi:hypothetical protein
MGEFDKEASQTRDYCVAKNPSVALALSGQAGTHRAARADPLRLRSGQAFAAQRTLARDDNGKPEILTRCPERADNCAAAGCQVFPLPIQGPSCPLLECAVRRDQNPTRAFGFAQGRLCLSKERGDEDGASS